MALWLIRAGKHGEYEQKFIADNRFYVTWSNLDIDLAKAKNQETLQAKLNSLYPTEKANTVKNWTTQLWTFAHKIKVGDWVVLPMKNKAVIYIGEVTGEYCYDEKAQEPFHHWIPIKWIGEDIARQNFSQDLLFSFGAFLTICQITRNDAEKRIRAMAAKKWNSEAYSYAQDNVEKETVEVNTNIEELAQDQIIRLIGTKFKGHALARLVDGILRAQGYYTFVSPPGPDGGVDILAGTGLLGFGTPRLCVQVKSQDSKIEAKEIKALKGAMQDSGATEGLYVAWGGFRNSVKEQESFFTVRLWDQQRLLEAFFEYYDRLDPELKAEIPLKKVWTLAGEEE